jgi:predicted transcriptional regulator
MNSAIEEIQFLANSANRVRVLEALTDGTTTRRELEDETGVPRSTVARALDEAESRRWVDSEGSRYWITPAGAARVDAFRRYVETTEGMHHLGEALGWLPDPVRELDYRSFRDATVTTPTQGNPTAPFDRAMELIREADEYRGLTQNSLPEYMDVVRDRVEREQMAFEAVLQRDFVAVLRDEPDRAATWRTVADRTWLYDGTVPLNMHVVDERVLIWLCDENHAGEEALVRGLLESGRPSVVSWAESLYEQYHSEAEPMDVEVLAPT